MVLEKRGLFPQLVQSTHGVKSIKWDVVLMIPPPWDFSSESSLWHFSWKDKRVLSYKQRLSLERNLSKGYCILTESWGKPGLRMQPRKRWKVTVWTDKVRTLLCGPKHLMRRLTPCYHWPWSLGTYSYGHQKILNSFSFALMAPKSKGAIHWLVKSRSPDHAWAQERLGRCIYTILASMWNISLDSLKFIWDRGRGFRKHSTGFRNWATPLRKKTYWFEKF